MLIWNQNRDLNVFFNKSNFVTKIKPINHLSIHGVGDGIKVCLCLYGDNAVLLLTNVYYTPASPIRLISILQLAQGTNKKSSLYTRETKSAVTWYDITTQVHHQAPSIIPLLHAYLGNPTYDGIAAFCSVFCLLKTIYCNNFAMINTLPLSLGSTDEHPSNEHPELVEINLNGDSAQQIDHFMHHFAHPMGRRIFSLSC